MSDANREFALVGDHAENLHSGAMLAPAERVTEADLDPGGGDQWLIDEGRLVLVETPDPPKVREQRARAKALGIDGYARMTPTKLAKAIEAAEAPIVRAAKSGVAEGDVGNGGDR
jgi:hypothetical protein